jgi:precorrin-6A/cobalt-precorrin-6A reductase
VAKLAAARDLGIPVIMTRRPPVPAVPTVGDAAAALAWLGHQAASARRGV